MGLIATFGVEERSDRGLRICNSRANRAQLYSTFDSKTRISMSSTNLNRMPDQGNE